MPPRSKRSSKPASPALTTSSVNGGKEPNPKPIDEHEGKKYLRSIKSATNETVAAVDVYAVLVAFKVTCPARAHAIKKLLCCGNRDKGSEMADLLGVEAAVARAIQLQAQRDQEASDGNS